MLRPGLKQFAVLAVMLALAGCGYGGPKREAWRSQEEQLCFARGDVQISSYVQERPQIGGRGLCGIDRPLTVSGLLKGALAVEPAATLNCAETAQVDRFMAQVVQPAARARFGQNAVAMLELAAYGCRTRNNVEGAKISEHAFGNAIDMAGFRLADGRHLRVKTGWHGDPDEQAFWQDVAYGACSMFRTVLGPGSDGYHEDHLHLDLLRHDPRGQRHICEPASIRFARGPAASPQLAARTMPPLPPVPAGRASTVQSLDRPNPFDPSVVGRARPVLPPASAQQGRGLPDTAPEEPGSTPYDQRPGTAPLYQPPGLPGTGLDGGLY